MALDFNRRSYTKTADQVGIDEGLRTYMLKVYNYILLAYKLLSLHQLQLDLQFY